MVEKSFTIPKKNFKFRTNEQLEFPEGFMYNIYILFYLNT